MGIFYSCPLEKLFYFLQISYKYPYQKYKAHSMIIECADITAPKMHQGLISNTSKVVLRQPLHAPRESIAGVTGRALILQEQLVDTTLLR